MNKSWAMFPIRRDERWSVALAFLWFMALMSGYFILRPIRETVGAGLGSDELRRLFLATFVAMLVAVPVYSKIVAMTRRTVLVAIVFGFLTLNVLLFALLLRPVETDAGATIGLWISRVYFVWVSVYSLFSVSVFWSVLADVFSNEQGKRLFGPIAGGATTGAIAASLFAGFLGRHVGVRGLLLVAFVLLCLGIVLGLTLTRHVRRESGRRDPPIPGVWTGFVEIAKSPYLVWICVYLALTSLAGTMVYMYMADVVRDAIPDPAAKTQFFARINLAVQCGTLVVQLAIVGNVMRRLGVAVALIVLPVIYLISCAALGIGVGIIGLAVIDVARRIGVYGFTSPAREVLFTVVNRQAKYKSKNFIDTVVFRGADAMTSSLFVAISRWAGSLTIVAWGMIPVAIGWAAVGWKLGREQRRLAQREASQTGGERDDGPDANAAGNAIENASDNRADTSKNNPLENPIE